MVSTYADLIREAGDDPRELVRIERPSEDRATVILNDPDRLNALSAPLVVQLRRRLDEVVHDPAVRSVVLTGAGSAFCAGGDIELMGTATTRLADRDDEEGASAPWRFIRRQFGGVVRLIASSDVAFIAALNGAAAGVGLAFALACDRVILSRRAVLVPAFAGLGLLPEVGTSWLLTRRLGYHRAFEFYVSEDPLDATTAVDLGLAAEVVDHEDLLAAADRWCDDIARVPSHTVRLAKPLLRAAADLTWDQALIMEEFAEPICFTTGSFRRAVSSFLLDREDDEGQS